MSDAHRHYLLDLGTLVKEDALDAVRDQLAAAPGEDAAFHAGRTLAYHGVVSLMRAQARAFGVPLADLGLDGFDPDAELLKGRPVGE